MKNLVIILLLLLAIVSCNTTKTITTTDSTANKKVSDTIRIANDSLEYEVTIIDVGFYSWLNGNARPRGFYSESYLENRNQIYTTEWNSRVLQSQRYNPNLYEMRIDYDRTIHYGYEVNYLIYNYMIYFQITNKQKLAGFFPRP